MDANSQLRTPGATPPMERWAKQGNLRGVVPYVNHVFGDNTTPSAPSSRAVATTPYKPNFTMGGTPPTAAPASGFDAGKYTKPSVDPTTGRYTTNEQILRNPGVAPEAPGVKGSVSNLVGASGSAAADAPAGRSGILQSARNGLRATGGFLSGAGSSGGDVGKVFSNVAGGVTGAAKAAAPVVGGLARFAAPLGAMYDATKIYGTDTDTYEKRFNLEGREGGLLSDLAVRGAGAATDLANTASFGGLRYLHDKMNGEGHWDGAGAGAGAGELPNAPVSKGPAATEIVASPNQTAETAKRLGLRLDERSDIPAAADPRRLDLDPGRSSLGASRDFTNELSGRPGGKMAALPNDLRQGVVHKTVDAQGRVTYSGRNVGVNGDGETQMVDGTGRTLKMLDGNNNSYVRSVGADGKPDGPMVVPGMTTLRGGAGGVNAALSAAAARGDMDAVRGYYADKGETFAGVTPGQYKLRQEEAGAPKRGEPGYNRYQAIKTARDQNETARRGQDQQMEIAMAPSRLVAQQRKMAADIFKQAGGDNARAAGLAMSLGMDPKVYQDAQAAQNTARASDQSVAEKFRDNAKKEFLVAGDDGKPNEIASGQMFDTARRLFPGIESADEKTRNAAMADAKELTGIFQKARGQDKVGFDALKFWEPRRAALSGMPDARGGRAETLSGFGGVVTLGASNGDTTLTKDGKTVNLGRLNQRQLELLNTAQQSNWGN